MDTFLNVRIPDTLVAELKAHKELTHEPTSSFVRRALEEALHGEGGVCEMDQLKAAAHHE